jgi:hypothetical protein
MNFDMLHEKWLHIMLSAHEKLLLIIILTNIIQYHVMQNIPKAQDYPTN